MSAVLEEVNTAAQLVPLSQAVEVNPKLDRSLLSDDLDVSFVPMAAVEALSGGIDVSTVRKYGEVKKGYTHFRDGDILFAKVTPCMENGKMAIARKLVNGVGFGSTEFHVLRPRADVDARYIYYFVSSQTFRKEASGHMTGAVGLRRVPSAYLEEQLISLPSIEQQREIVAEVEKQFSRLDEAVANLQRVKANLKRYKASVLNDAVEGRLVEGDYQYEMVKLGSVANVVDPQPSHRTPPKQADGVPYIGIGDVLGNGKVDLQNSRKVAPTVLAEHRARYTLRMGDFIFGKIGTLGKPTLLLPPYNYTLSANVVLVQADGVRLLPEYALIFMESPKLVNMVNRDAKATTQAAYGIKRMRDLDIELPTIEVQLQITSEVDRRLSLLRRVESEVDINLKRAQALRQATLHKAFGPS